VTPAQHGDEELLDHVFHSDDDAGQLPGNLRILLVQFADRLDFLGVVFLRF